MHRMVKDKSNELNLLDKEMKRAQGEERAVSRDFGSGNKEFESKPLVFRNMKNSKDIMTDKKTPEIV